MYAVVTHKASRLAAIFILVSLFFSACKVQMIPAYDAALSQEIDDASKMVDNLYLTMLAKPKGPERDYAKAVSDYIAVEVELNAILTKNRIRPLNESSTRIAEIAVQIWQKYKQEHKTDNTLSDGIIKLNQKYMSDLFYAMRVAEEGKRMSITTN